MGKLRHSRWAWNLTITIPLLILILRMHPKHSQTMEITDDRCALIRRGMDRAEVSRVLGGPPGDYSTGAPTLFLDPYGGGILMTSDVVDEWKGDDGWIQVGFDEKGRVRWSRFVQTPRLKRNNW